MIWICILFFAAGLAFGFTIAACCAAAGRHDDREEWRYNNHGGT